MGEGQPSIVALLIVVSSLGFLTLAVVTMTSFIKMSTILFLLRNALGIQQTPPNIVLYGVALLLTAFVMAPVLNKVYTDVAVPGQGYSTFDDFRHVASKAEIPVKAFMERFTSVGEREFFVNAAQRLWGPDSGLTAAPDDMLIVLPSFVLSELRRGFEAGFLIYLPFIAVDLVTTSVLMAMGMSAVSPTTISVPFKLFLFVAIAGWTRLVHGLVIGYAS
jgi:type III secretion protein R